MATIDKITLPSTGVTYDIKDNVSGYVTAQTAPVTSVNGMTGDVVVGGGGGSYTATAPINIDSNDNISHDASGVTAGTYYPRSEGKGSWNLPSITVDAKGHITSASNIGATIPNAKDDSSARGGLITQTQFITIAAGCDTSMRVQQVILHAGQTSVTKTITPLTNPLYGYLSGVYVQGVFAYDDTTYESVFVDYTQSADPYLQRPSQTVTISIASAYAHDIVIDILYTNAYTM